MEMISSIFSAFGLSSSAGLNAYIPLFTIALIARYTDWFKLSPPFNTLTQPWIIILLGVLILVEFLADKFPAINHINDVIQTFIRPVAGAIVFAASARMLTDIHPVLSMACGLLVAGGVHLAKSLVVRPFVTASTAGAGNIPVSIAEDVFSTITSILAVILPVLMLVLFIISLILFIFWLQKRAQRKAHHPARS